MTTSPKISLIDNTGPNCLLPFLRAAGDACTQIDIAVAFITVPGLESVLHILQRVARKGHVRILTGLYQGFTEPKALAILLREQTESDHRLSVRICRDKRFHWKTYFLMTRRSATAIVGSSNMTAEGLAEPGEMNLVLRANRDAKQFCTVHSAFERYWDNRSQPLSKGIVDAYRQWGLRQLARRLPSVPIAKILGSPGGQEPPLNPARQKGYWRLSCVGTLTPATDDLLERLTNWDKKHYETLSTFTPRIRTGDLAVMFDFPARRMNLVEIKDHVETPMSTPDGRYFIAYQVVRSSKTKRLTPTLWKQLRNRRIVRGKEAAKHIKPLSEKAYHAAKELLQGK